MLLWDADSLRPRQLAAVAAMHNGNVRASEAKPGTCLLKVALARERESLEAIIHAAIAYTAKQGSVAAVGHIAVASAEAAVL